MIYVLSGGASLNFKVVGGTSQPSSASENTIWVNTSTAISEWVFSATQPTSPTAGMVWIQTSSFSTASFNALKKNNITVYPAGCKQYVSGAWTNKTAKTYQGGAWVEWIVHLFKDGVTSDVAGGWEGWKIPYESSLASYAQAATVSVSSSAITANIANGYGITGAFRSKNLINVSSFKTLEIVVTDVQGVDDKGAYVGLLPSTAASAADAVAIKQMPDGKAGTYTLDISNISGEYYVAVILCSYTDTASVTATRITLL